eukprot:11670568-Heterocapsa_arctica.AAC.1
MGSARLIRMLLRCALPLPFALAPGGRGIDDLTEVSKAREMFKKSLARPWTDLGGSKGCAGSSSSVQCENLRAESLTGWAILALMVNSKSSESSMVEQSSPGNHSND